MILTPDFLHIRVSTGCSISASAKNSSNIWPSTFWTNSSEPCSQRASPRNLVHPLPSLDTSPLSLAPTVRLRLDNKIITITCPCHGCAHILVSMKERDQGGLPGMD